VNEDKELLEACRDWRHESVPTGVADYYAEAAFKAGAKFERGRAEALLDIAEEALREIADMGEYRAAYALAAIEKARRGGGELE
jgi:hypothetical protein